MEWLLIRNGQSLQNFVLLRIKRHAQNIFPSDVEWTEERAMFCYQVSDLYPGRYAGLYWSVKDASITTEYGGITCHIVGRLNVNADDSKGSDKLFSSKFVSKTYHTHYYGSVFFQVFP